jgi:hypothetical protein
MVRLHVHMMDDWIVLEEIPNACCRTNTPTDRCFVLGETSPSMGDSLQTKATLAIAYTRRRKFHTPDVWEKNRARITRLYIDQSMTLQEVQATMSERHGFDAR